MFRKLTDLFYSMRFGQRLCVILILFALIPMLLIQQILMHFYEQHIVDSASNSAYSIVNANNNSLEMLMDNIETAAQQMIDSQFYYDTFSELNNFSVGDCLRYDRILTQELSKQFIYQDAVYDVYLYTSRWLFGVNTALMPITIESFQKAGFEELARNASGLSCWVTGYDYGKRTQNDYLTKKGSYDFQHPLTMLKEMQFQYTSQGYYQRLSDDTEKPILVVQVLEKSLRSLYKDSIPYDGSLYAITNNEGIVISSDNESFPVGSRIPENLFPYLGTSGYVTYDYNRETNLLCYDTLNERGFFSFALIPMKNLTQNAVRKMRYLLWICSLILILLAALVAFVLSRTITRPIAALTKAAIRVSQSDFSANTPIPRGRDFKVLTESFNHMEKEISRLIHENYEISIREKETQLMALTMQINPHFLYNTLNTINMLAIQNDDDETAELIVSLSEMLQYTCKDSSDQAPLSDEIGWVSNYLFLMAKRYNGLFRTVFDITEDLMDCRIPKFILQPLAENSILHGFSDIQKEGILTLAISKSENSLCIEVRDNGIGMDEEQLKKYIQAICVDGHVGISNVHRRLSLIYGENYKIHVVSAPGEGTSIKIWIPLEY
ncbi:MAG: sensor histidine kinase [Blautia sp.]|nr:sensor histidine kinase [Blautia sp.]MDY2896626.1 sensor histidine kinase [Candidatus Limivivens sp.]